MKLEAWPFTLAELTAGLRRYFAEPGLQVLAAHEHAMPLYGGTPAAPSRVRGVRVEYQTGPHTLSLLCVLKEPQGASRAGLAGAGRREAGVYRALASQLPMALPALVVADSAGEWLVLEAVAPKLLPADWQAEHYLQAVHGLADLHERFWKLSDDLAAYTWLAFPLTNDFPIHVYAAAQALAKIIANDWPQSLSRSAATLHIIAHMVAQAEYIVAPLRALPATLLHGNFWPGSLSLTDEDELLVFDWRLASVGPGILDLVPLVVNSQWLLGALPLPPATLIAHYRAEMARRLNAQWTDAEWDTLWDHALLWRFLQETLAWLASAPRAAFTVPGMVAFQTHWLQPVFAAATRRLDWPTE